jgi:hypothetical protein
MLTEFLFESLKERDSLKELGVVGGIILKYRLDYRNKVLHCAYFRQRRFYIRYLSTTG